MPKPENMRVTFWGTRGSCPTFPAPWEVQDYADRISSATVRAAIAHFTEQLKNGVSLDEIQKQLQRSPGEIVSDLAIDHLPIFGGETTCVEVETSEGNVLIFDWGSGIRHCASRIMRKRGETQLKDLYLFGSHEHLDHRIGLSFAGFCFADPPFDIRIFGNAGVLKALDEHFALFSHIVSESTYHDDPIDYAMISASIRGIELRSLDGEGELGAGGPWQERDIADPIVIGSTVVRPFKVYHGLTDCLGYKIEHAGKSFVFCTDHEKLGPEAESHPDVSKAAVSRSLQAERGLVEACRGADLAYFDGQYSREEYYGRQCIGSSPAVSRVGWGHGCIEDILDRVGETGTKHALIGHHDPERSWPAQLAMDEQLRDYSAGKEFLVELARDGQIVDL